MGWETIGWAIFKIAVSVAVSYAMRQDQPDTEGPRLDSLSVQTSAYGRPIRKGWGSFRAAGNVIWSAGLEEHKHKEDVGKGGGGGSHTTYTYTASFAVAICEGELKGIRRIWGDGKLIYDKSESANLEQNIKSNDVAASVSIYLGTEDQEPDPLIESHEGEGNVPAHRGIAYIVFEDFELGDFGNRIPNLEFEVATRAEEQDYTFEIPDDAKKMEVFENGYIAVAKGNHENPDQAWLQIYNFAGRDLIYERTGIDSDYLFSYPHEELGDMVLYIEDRNDDFYIIDALSGRKLQYKENFWNEDPHEDANPNAADVGYLPWLDYPMWLYWDYKTSELRFCYHPVSTGYPMRPSLTIETGYHSKPWVKIFDEKVYVAFGDDRSTLFEYESPQDMTSESDEEDPISAENPRNYSRKSDVSETSGGEFIAVTPDGDFISKNGGTAYVHDGMGPEIKQVSTYHNDDYSLTGILDDIFEMAGLSSDQYDSNELSDDTVIGYVQTDVMAAEELLKPLMRTYQFDIVEQDWKLVCRKRGGSVQTDIPWGDLGAREAGAEPEEPLTESIADEMDLPYEIVLEYNDYDKDYQTSVEFARRSMSATAARSKKNLRYPLVMNATQAVRAVETLFETAWTQRNSYKFKIPIDYAKLSPGDVITIAETYKLLISKIAFSFPLIMEVEASSEESGSYISDTEGVSPYHTPQQVATLATVFPVYMDIPSIEGVLSDPAFYFAVFALEAGETTAILYRSLDDGDTWDAVAVADELSVVGYVTDVLADGPTAVVDEGNSINVRLQSYDAELNGASLLSVFAGTNTAAIGVNGRWEIVSFSEVEEEDDGTFTISKLVRGRRGTDHNTGNHEEQDQFVLLESGKTVRKSISEENLDSNVLYRMVPDGTSVNSASTQGFRCTGRSIQPYSPVHIKGRRNSSGDLTIEWIRRSRASGGWNQSGVAMMEESEKYEIDIYDGDSVVRTIEVKDQTEATYTAEDQESDFGSTQSSITVKIYQISATVGRGFGREATL